MCHVESVQAITYSLNSPPIAVLPSPCSVATSLPPTAPPCAYNKQRPPREPAGRSCNEGRGGGRVVLERWGDLLLGLVVTSKTVDTRLDQDETELGVLVLAVRLKVFADSNCFLDEMPKVFRDVRRET